MIYKKILEELWKSLHWNKHPLDRLKERSNWDLKTARIDIINSIVRWNVSISSQDRFLVKWELAFYVVHINWWVITVLKNDMIDRNEFNNHWSKPLFDMLYKKRFKTDITQRDRDEDRVINKQRFDKHPNKKAHKTQGLLEYKKKKKEPIDF